MALTGNTVVGTQGSAFAGMDSAYAQSGYLNATPVPRAPFTAILSGYVERARTAADSFEATAGFNPDSLPPALVLSGDLGVTALLDMLGVEISRLEGHAACFGDAVGRL